jgi:putative ABC transport system substrate-binding protein
MAMIFADSDVIESSLVKQLMQSLGVQVLSHAVHDTISIDKAFSGILRERPQFIMVLVSAFTITHRQRLASFAIKARIPLISEGRDWAAAGALVAYGPNPLEMMRRTATYVDRILKGAKAAELPFGQPDKFELVVNQTTANAIGVRIPDSILLRADAVVR